MSEVEDKRKAELLQKIDELTDDEFITFTARLMNYLPREGQVEFMSSMMQFFIDHATEERRQKFLAWLRENFDVIEEWHPYH